MADKQTPHLYSVLHELFPPALACLLAFGLEHCLVGFSLSQGWVHMIILAKTFQGLPMNSISLSLMCLFAIIYVHIFRLVLLNDVLSFLVLVDVHNENKDDSYGYNDRKNV